MAWYGECTEELATTPLVLAEVDHLALSRAGLQAARACRHDAAPGAYAVEWWSSATPDAVELAERYEDLGAGLTDASLVALATFDVRHFRAMRPLAGGEAFHLLPLDGP